jgi:hypothetical protein
MHLDSHFADRQLVRNLLVHEAGNLLAFHCRPNDALQHRYRVGEAQQNCPTLSPRRRPHRSRGLFSRRATRSRMTRAIRPGRNGVDPRRPGCARRCKLGVRRIRYPIIGLRVAPSPWPRWPHRRGFFVARAATSSCRTVRRTRAARCDLVASSAGTILLIERGLCRVP